MNIIRNIIEMEYKEASLGQKTFSFVIVEVKLSSCLSAAGWSVGLSVIISSFTFHAPITCSIMDAPRKSEI